MPAPLLKGLSPNLHAGVSHRLPRPTIASGILGRGADRIGTSCEYFREAGTLESVTHSCRPGSLTMKHGDFSWVTTSELRRLATATTPWNYYLATEVYISTPEIAGVVRPVFDGGCAEPPFGPLHVVSATQPGSDPDSYENVERLAVLDRELQDLGIESVPALGRSFDGKHQEQSRAVFGLDDIAARALGARFGQVAIFSWKGPWWSLLACTDARTERQAWRWEPASSDR